MSTELLLCNNHISDVFTAAAGASKRYAFVKDDLNSPEKHYLLLHLAYIGTAERLHQDYIKP